MNIFNWFICNHINKRFPTLIKLEYRKEKRMGVPVYYYVAYVYDECRGESNFNRQNFEQFLKNYFLLDTKFKVIYEKDMLITNFENENGYDTDDDSWVRDDWDGDSWWEDEVMDLRGKRFPT